jgi:hypothetical protein
MSSIGVAEILLIFVLLGAVIAATVLILLRRDQRRNPPSYISAWQDQRTLAPPVSDDLQGQAYALASQGKKIHAIKLVRQHTGLGLKEAKAYVDALAAGRNPPPLGHAGFAREDLAARVRRLKSDGRAEQAVFLVRGETGMEQADAEAFVHQL